MNLDLIIKLVKLANNNPNENEANLAARKVCKLIAEGNFKFSSNGNITSKPEEKPLTWNDVKRSTEPYWRSSGPSRNPWDLFNDFYRENRSNQNKHYYEAGWNIPNTSRKEKECIDRKCTKCGVIVSTSNKAEIFVCGICRWAKYNEEKTTSP